MTNIELLRALVKIDSTSGLENENEIILFLKDFLKPYASKIKLLGTKRKNILAFFGDLKSKNILVLNGHLDVVEADKLEWHYNPFDLTINGNFAYGRGVGDMKGGIVSTLFAIIKAKQNGLLKDKLIIFAGSCDEENGANSKFGTSVVVDYFLKNNIKPQGCIIPEPNGMQREPKINIGSRGLLWIRAESIGQKMHSGLIKEEDNAIMNMMEFLNELKKKFTNQPKKDFKGIPGSSARITMINGGGSVFNVVPNHSVCQIDLRVSPNDKNNQIIKFVQRLAIKHGVKIEIIKNTPSACIKRSEKVLTKTISCLEAMGKRYEVGYSSPSNDSHFFIDAKIPTIVALGVEAENVHANDENILIDSLRKSEEMIYEVIKEW
ncbi:MAG: M20 family metallopeptidase [Clostridia bacterium]|nr:M20 family metallopeptidase [Clostridia bacterium]